MATEAALRKAAQAWCKSATSHRVMVPELAEAFADIIDEYREALIWCSGSADFGEGGQARAGWLVGVQPLLDVDSIPVFDERTEPLNSYSNRHPNRFELMDI